ncbi:hypothetical protein N9777_02995 [Ascidiaceihabitans sp.]|nr:hypothetical protein [Ascidiaceihabitans sp.]|tara:strand:- start:128 stop:376 length:249 start_codon:yes stop_codon:yes gene_type:complete
MEKAVFFTNQDAFEAWIKNNPNATEVWLGYLRKVRGATASRGLNLSTLPCALAGSTASEKASIMRAIRSVSHLARRQAFGVQ